MSERANPPSNVFNMGGTQSADGSWNGLASLQFVTVGDPGNVADTTGYGSVGNVYQMGKYDVTVGQYCQFLNTAPINTLPDTGNHANFYDLYHTGNGGYTDPTDFLTPVGDFVDSPGPYGTYDMGGDVFQWNESMFQSRRGSGGGSWDDKYGFDLGSASSSSCLPLANYSNVGFRVASEAVPEPGSLALLLAGAVAFGIWRRRRKA